MDEENKQDQQNNADAKPDSGQSHQAGPNVRVFGADMSGGAKNETKEEWRKRKDEWKQKHREHIQERRDDWKAQRREWHDEHHYGGGGMFWGMVLLFAGVIGLLYTMGFISHAFWYAIVPFWPILLILWGASLVLGRHWFARFIIFLFALAFLIIIIFYGLAKTNSPLVSSLSPNVVRAVQTTQPPQY